MSLVPGALMATLSSHLDLSKSRVATFTTLIVGCICARTVNLSHIASHFNSNAQLASNYRRLQRFFQYVRLDEDRLAQMIAALLGTHGPYVFCLDRTNWKIGRSHINLLVLCIVARRVRVPILWTVLDKAGTCNFEDRKALMERAIKCFGPGSIKVLLADREFIGSRWFDYLVENQIPFAIRVKKALRVELNDGRCLSLASLFQKHRHRRVASAHQGRFTGMNKDGGQGFWFAAKQLSDGSLLIIATNMEPQKGVNIYKRRWQIECLFGDTKTRGLNMEDTRMTNPHKLSCLIAIAAIAIVWSHLCAAKIKGHKNIKRANHGYRRKSWFRTGFDILRKWILYHPDKAESVWLKRWKTRKISIQTGRVV
jgi:hypothetical protein